MNRTLNFDSANRVLAPDEGSWTTVEITESETAALRVGSTQPWLWYARALLHVITGVLAILYSFGAPALVVVLLVCLFTR